MRTFTLLAAGVLLTLATAPATYAFAQSGTSAIVGIIKDPAGDPVPGVQVSVANESTGITVQSVTNAEGAYRVSALVPGMYRLVVTLDGFDSVTRQQITLEVGKTLAIDVTLDLQKRTEAVEVIAAADVPSRRRDAGIPHDLQRRRRGVRPLYRRRRDDVDAIGDEPLPRQPVRVVAERCVEREELLRGDGVSVAAEPVRRHVRRSDPAGKDIFLHVVGTHAAAHERYGALDGADAAEPPGGFLGSPEQLRCARRHLRS